MNSFPPLGQEVPALPTWTCHICGEERPDRRISVFQTDLSKQYGLPPGVMWHNVRYCNDRAGCIHAAPNHRLLPDCFHDPKEVA
jgi:hypothetical protein